MSMTPSNPAPPRQDVMCLPFEPAMFRRELWRDSFLRWLIAMVFPVTSILILGVGEEYGHEFAQPGFFLFIACMTGWLVSGFSGSRVVRRLPAVTALIENGDPAAESELAAMLARKALQRSVRLLLNHRLAMLRQRQGRMAEVQTIAHELLRVRAASAAAVRSSLLLMAVESGLEIGDLTSAYAGLMELERQSLSSADALLCVWLRTRYELASGHDESAMSELDRRVAQAEMMPPPQCGAMHAMLAAAANRTGRTVQADWLRRRAALLCTPEQASFFGAVG